MASSSFDSSFFSNRLHPHRHTSRWTKLGLGASVASIAFAAGVASVQLSSPESSASRGDPIWRQCSSGGVAHGFFPFASVSQSLASSFTEPKTGVSFPTSIVISDAGDDDDKNSTELNLAGTGLRKKNILGLKNITVYAFGVYANESGLKEKLDSGNTYDEYEVSDLTQNKAFYDDLAKSDFEMRVRLVIVYGRLKIGSVRSAFEDSIGSRIKKFNGQEDKPLLESFTKLFQDDIKLPSGTIIDITRHSGHILKTKIGDIELGAVQSPLLCRAFLDLYIGEEPFDTKGKEEIGSRLASVVRS